MANRPPAQYQKKNADRQEVIMGRNPNINYASTISRIIAYIIDAIIVGLVIGILSAAIMLLGVFSFGSITGDGGGGFLPVAIFGPAYIGLSFGSFILQLLYFTYLESEEGGGATIGKKILDLKVVDRTGRKVDMKDSFIRNIARLIWSLPCVGFLLLLLDVYLIHDSEQRIGDRLANTYVVKESEYGEITRQYEEGYRQQGMPQEKQTYQQTQTGEMQKCPKCGKKALMVSPDGSAYCTKCDYTSMDSEQHQ